MVRGSWCAAAWITGAACAALLAACTNVDDRLGATGATKYGTVLVDGRGRTLYFHDEDLPSKSQCTPACTVLWPPAEAGDAARPQGEFTIIVRESGTRQWAYGGRPLYRSVLDFAPGYALGEGTDGEWRVAKP